MFFIAYNRIEITGVHITYLTTFLPAVNHNKICTIFFTSLLQSPLGLGGLLRGGPGPPVLQGSAGHAEVGQEEGGFQGAGVIAGSTGWGHHDERAVHSSRI